jgi:hypothetical protein
MSRLFFLPGFVVLGCAILAVAQEPAAPPDDTVPARALHRNRELIQALVRSGLCLAAEEDPVKRADSCNELALRFAGEIGQAATEHDHARAVELGDCLYAVLKQGVAFNLGTARRLTPPGSAHELEINRVGDRASHLTEPLEKLLQNPDAVGAGDLRPVVQKLRDARWEVEKAWKRPE